MATFEQLGHVEAKPSTARSSHDGSVYVRDCPTLPSTASAGHGSYLGISCRQRGRRMTAEDDPDRPFAHALSCKGKNHGFGPRGKYSHPIMPAALMIGHQSRFGPSAMQRTLGRLQLAREDSLVDFREALTHGRVGGAAQPRNRATARCNGSLPLRELFTACATKERRTL